MRRPAIGVNERGGDSAGHAAEVLVLDKKIGRWHPQRRMIRTDIPDYPAALRDVACVLRAGGVVVQIGLRSCFCGGLPDASECNALVIRPGYRDSHWTRECVQAWVGATHLPLPALLQHFFLDAGRRSRASRRAGSPAPVVVAARLRK
jgi:hypothetical protein